MAAMIPRLDLHQRLQHGALFLSVAAALFTGYGIVFLPGGLGLDFDLLYRSHQWAGFACGSVALYHILYLFVRGYVEGRNWSNFPLAWKKDDLRILQEDIGFLAGSREERPEAGFFRPSQKALFWSTGFFLAGLSFTGIAIGYWEGFPGPSPLVTVLSMARLHRGLSLLFFAVLLWHLYGAFVFGGRPSVQWTWLTGTISEGLAKNKVPGFYREHLRLEAERQAVMGKKNIEEIEEEERQKDRGVVEEDLTEGNRLAREEKYVDALYHYRRALERYPGYSQARYNMAVVLRKMGERAMAAENFRQFLNEDPFHPLSSKAQEFIAEIEGEEQ